jgi:hypothetical protein
LKIYAVDVAVEIHFAQADSSAVVPEPTAQPSAWEMRARQ